MSEESNEEMQICPTCKGVGKIDLAVHFVPPGSDKCSCGLTRPTSDRRRTTNPERVTCGNCRLGMNHSGIDPTPPPEPRVEVRETRIKKDPGKRT